MANISYRFLYGNFSARRNVSGRGAFIRKECTAT